jgi:xanthine dehydrogenase accessory factor
MSTIYEAVLEATQRGDSVALATIVKATGSTPREAGTKMLIYPDGSTVDTIGGGSLEANVIAEAQAALGEGKPRLVRYELRDSEVGDPGICGGEAEIFIDVINPHPTVLIVGAGHVGRSIAVLSSFLGFHTVVLDDRAEFANAERLPQADEIIVGDIVEELVRLNIAPQTHIVLVTRGHEHDRDALRQVVSSSAAAYIGMIGSQRKVKMVFDELRKDGVAEEALAAVHAPIGLDIHAETPEEIALSIMAEIVMVRRGGKGGLMRLGEG